MPLNCPVCKAENAAGPNCRRCKADLAMLFALSEHRTQLLAATRAAFARHEIADAWRFALAANEHQPDAESLRWVAMLQLLHGNFGEAWNAYRAMNQCLKPS